VAHGSGQAGRGLKDANRELKKRQKKRTMVENTLIYDAKICRYVKEKRLCAKA